MRKAIVYVNGEPAGTLTEHDRESYTFTYHDAWYADPDRPAISMTLPKSRQEHKSSILFPFFFNMLSEGVNRQLQSRTLQIDEKDHFGLLLAVAQDDTIGSVTVKPVES